MKLSEETIIRAISSMYVIYEDMYMFLNSNEEDTEVLKRDHIITQQKLLTQAIKEMEEYKSVIYTH